MIDTTLAIGLALLAGIVGMVFSWWWFGEDLRAQDKEIEKLDKDVEYWQRCTHDAEQSLELVLGEGDSRPLTAPVQLIRGAR